ncbi:MAG: hypothetical protein V1875_04635 [Candidatus Altiarchaeota archaeon]
MRALPLLVAVIVLAAGCIIPPPQKIQKSPVESQEITTTTTSSTTTTTHMILDIRPLNALKTTSTSIPPSTTSSTSTTSSSTSTTVTLILRMRESEAYEKMTFFLTGVEEVRGVTYYSLDYTTGDGQAGRIRFSGTTLIDDRELGVARQGQQITAKISIRENRELKDRAPAGSTILSLGAGLQNRSFDVYRIGMENVQSDRIRLSFDDGQNTTQAELSQGDVAYFDGMEVGALETRIPGNLAAIYLLKDTDVYDRSGGQRYCMRKFVTYPKATPLIVDGMSNLSVGAATLTVFGIGDGVVTLSAAEGGLSRNLQLSCGATLDLSGTKYNLVWYGGDRDGCAKIVAHG